MIISFEGIASLTIGDNFFAKRFLTISVTAQTVIGVSLATQGKWSFVGRTADRNREAILHCHKHARYQYLHTHVPIGF